MAVQWSGIYDPLIFDGAVQEAAIELNRFLSSGVMARDSRIDTMASGAGQVGELPFFNGITNDEPNYSSADPAETSTPAVISGATQVYRSAHANKSWTTMDMARELGLQDPLLAVVNRIGKYWAVNTEKRLIYSALGMLADNIANDAGDMANDISDAAVVPDAANTISADAVIDAHATMGDHAPALVAMAMHSVVYFNLQKQNLIDYIPNARGEINIPTYLGYRVIVDDSLFPDTTGANPVYTTILFAPDAFAYGSGVPEMPSEIERKPDSGNGGGEEILYSRVTEIVHPWGFAFASAGLAGQSADYSELSDATEWDRVYVERKNVGLAFLKTNG